MTNVRSIAIDDTRIAFDDSGTGEALVFLHAGLGDRKMFDRQIDHFRDQYRVICPDARGFGESRRTSAPFKSSLDVIAVLDNLGIDRAHIVGVSMGSRVAAEVAMANPDRVISLTLVSTMLGTSPSADMYASWTVITGLMTEGNFDEANELLVQMWIDGPLRPSSDVDRQFRDAAATMNSAILVRDDKFESELEFEPPVSERLHEIKAPLAVIWGDKDVGDVLEAGRLLRLQVPDAFFRVIADASHLPQMERPDAFNEALSEFLKSVS